MDIIVPWNVHYTPLPVQHERIGDAGSLRAGKRRQAVRLPLSRAHNVPHLNAANNQRIRNQGAMEIGRAHV